VKVRREREEQFHLNRIRKRLPSLRR
jgi:hypothetical protein